MKKTELPRRKKIRHSEHDYSSAGAYFVTICVLSRYAMLWESVERRQSESQVLSRYGQVVEEGILRISEFYENVIIDKYCIMPDHIHMIVSIHAKEGGRMISAPTLSAIVGQMKRWISKQLGFSLWQKSYYDRIIRDEDEYLAICKYIEENPENAGLDTLRPPVL